MWMTEYSSVQQTFCKYHTLETVISAGDSKKIDK